MSTIPPPLPRRIPLPAGITEKELMHMEDVVFSPSHPQRSDLMFVFGYGSDDWQHVVDLLNQNLAPIVLCTGSHAATLPFDGTHESHRIRSFLVGHGIDPKRILVEDRSVSTRENVRFGKEVLEHQGMHPRSILFVCRSHHSGRCLRILRDAFPNVTLSCATNDFVYDGDVLSRSKWRNSVNTRERVHAEYQRVMRYEGRGRER